MAHEYRATVKWQRAADAKFTYQRYSRGHTWSFDGGITVPGSSSPLSVRLPYSVAEAIDPEEAFDEAVGEMTKNESGRMWVSKVVLAPVIVFSGEKRPNDAQLDVLHHLAHEEC